MRILSIEQAATLIQAGEVVAYPTETVYGLGTNPFSETAVERLFSVKGRDPNNPILLVVANERQLAEVIREVSLETRRIMDRFWPGPLSLLFPCSASLPKALTGGSDKICVRMTSCAAARDLCLAVGHAITSTSANLSGLPPARSVSEIELEGLAGCIDGGTLPPSAPSTVYDPELRRVLRQGAVPEEAILDCLL